MSSLGENAKKIISEYNSLPFNLPNITVKCPYYNNRRGKSLAGLRPLIGKGNPEEIVNEVWIIALREKISLKELSSQKFTEFLVDHNIGIDCSGFVYHVLDTESRFRENINKPLKKLLHLAQNKSLIRRWLAKIRPAENTSVRDFANDKNSKIIIPSSAEAGDIITMIHVEKERIMYDHILIITDKEVTPEGKIKLSYSHSISWPEDGKYGHGISRGTITLNKDQKITDGFWEEKNVEESKNRTKNRALLCSKCEVRRIF